MLKRFVIFLCLVQSFAYAGGPVSWKYLYEKVNENDTFVEVAIVKLEKLYFHDEKQVSFEELETAYEKYFDSHDEDRKNQNFLVQSHVTLQVKSVLMADGNFKIGKELKLVWGDSYDSMCPHDESWLNEGDVTILYRSSEDKQKKWRAIRSEFVESLKLLVRWVLQEKLRFEKIRAVEKANGFGDFSEDFEE